MGKEMGEGVPPCLLRHGGARAHAPAQRGRRVRRGRERGRRVLPGRGRPTLPGRGRRDLPRAALTLHAPHAHAHAPHGS